MCCKRKLYILRFRILKLIPISKTVVQYIGIVRLLARLLRPKSIVPITESSMYVENTVLTFELINCNMEQLNIEGDLFIN